MNTHVHFIGIGGIGMSGIARILLRNGIKVSGSDLKDNRIINELRALGAHVFKGHNPGYISGADVVVWSSAIREDNPEIIEAKRLSIPLMKRAEALAQLMKDKFVVTVAGSHGKTTTTSLISYLLSEAGFFPTAAIGGILRNIDTNTYLGDGKFFVAEADESDGSFLCYTPNLSVITNIDHEHLDYYKDFESEVDAFEKFIHRTAQDGCIFCCDDDVRLKDIVKRYENRYVLFGLKKSAHIYPENIEIHGLSSRFDCVYRNKFAGRFYLSLAGTHNISNVLAVIAVGLELGIDTEIIKKTLAGYKGAGRRIEVKFDNKEYMVIDDYAHHPTEIKATLAAVQSIKRNRIIAVFQPHRYTRTQLLLDEFGQSFDSAQQVFVTDVYAASELPLEGVTGGSVADRIKAHSPDKEITFLPKEELVKRILKIIRPGDLVITLGAGDITKICDELVEELKR
jgi:UDP-N-acetylmuramate--alanine ligase